MKYVHFTYKFDSVGFTFHQGKKTSLHGTAELYLHALLLLTQNIYHTPHIVPKNLQPGPKTKTL